MTVHLYASLSVCYPTTNAFTAIRCLGTYIVLSHESIKVKLPSYITLYPTFLVISKTLIHQNDCDHQSSVHLDRNHREGEFNLDLEHQLPAKPRCTKSSLESKLRSHCKPGRCRSRSPIAIRTHVAAQSVFLLIVSACPGQARLTS